MASSFPPRATDATYADNLGTDFVTIYVGPERKQYGVHKNLLISQSDYFDKALNGGFKEAGEGAIHLEEDDPAAIALLIGWLYRGVIPGPAALSVHIEGAFPLSTVDKVVLPAGGTSVEVEVHTELEPNRPPGQADINCFQTILFHPRYRGYSSEELRWADYNEGRKYKPGSEELPDTGPDLSSSGIHGTSAAARGLHVWPAPTLPSLQGSMPQAAVGFGVLPPQQGGAGLANVPVVGGGVALPAAGGTGLFGSTLFHGGGIAGVVQPAASHLPAGHGLFGNPRPAGSNIFGPSAGASSGGVGVNLGTRTQNISVGLFGGLGQQSQPSAGGIPASQLPSVGCFGQFGSQAQSQPSSGGLQSTLFTRNSIFSSLIPTPTANPSGVNLSTAPIAPQPASSNSVFGTPAGGSVTSTAPPSGTSSLFGVAAPANATSVSQSNGGRSVSDSYPSDYPADGSSSDEDDVSATRPALPRPSNIYQPSSGTQLGQSAIPSSASTSTTSTSTTPTLTPNPPPPHNLFPFPPRTQSTAPFSSTPYRAAPGINPWRAPSPALSSKPSLFNPSSFITTSQNPFDTTFTTYTTPSHQLALLNLTLFAEATCWPTLYNASITSYISGERTLTRPPPLEHITLIYERTHDESSLRRWAVDSLAAHKGIVDMSGYMGLLVEYEGFLEGVLKKLREKAQLGDEPGPGWDGAGGLRYRMLDQHGKRNPFGGGGEDKGKGKGDGSLDMRDL